MRIAIKTLQIQGDWPYSGLGVGVFKADRINRIHGKFKNCDLVFVFAFHKCSDLFSWLSLSLSIYYFGPLLLLVHCFFKPNYVLRPSRSVRKRTWIISSPHPSHYVCAHTTITSTFMALSLCNRPQSNQKLWVQCASGPVAIAVAAAAAASK